MTQTTLQAVQARMLEILTKAPEDVPPNHHRFHVAARTGYPLGVVGHLIFLLVFWALDLKVLAAFNVASVAIFALATWQQDRGRMWWPSILTNLEIVLHAVLATLYVGTLPAFWALILIAISAILLTPFYSRRLRVLLCLMLVAIMIGTGILGSLRAPLQPVSTETALFFFAINFGILTLVVATLLMTYDLAVERAEAALRAEMARAEGLLLNILPAAIAARLKAHEEPLADRHESVSVLFADLAGFTALSRSLSADELVGLLNDLFSRFDRLVEAHGAEKIKTIGDAYMAATGLGGGPGNHAEQIAALALDMQRSFGAFRIRNGVDLKLRIGVHSGPVIAGVIGERKFSYDLWGDTVNLASRMESEGLPDRIQITAETQALIRDRFVTTPRGVIGVRGHAPRETFFLEGRAAT